MRVLYVNPIAVGANPAIDVLGYGLQHRLARAGVEARVGGIVLYTLDPDIPAAEVARARDAGIGVFTLTRPRFPVDASLVYPNFNHGLYMAEHLATLVPPGARVGVIGGPDTSDDVEEVVGILHGCAVRGLEVVNDPHADRYKNVTDAAEGGYAAALHMLADFPGLDALVPYNDETMLGVLEALDEVGRPPGIRLLSRNGTPHGVAAVRDGRSDGTWDLDPPGMGLAIGELVVRQLVNGERLNGELAASPVGRMITRDNADTWVPWEERVDARPFTVGL